MTFTLLLGTVAMLLVLLIYALRPRRANQAGAPHMEGIEELARQHASYFGLIRRAMSQEDFEFLALRGPVRLVRRAHRERQRISLVYLADLRADFQTLLRLARVITVLSPRSEEHT